MMDAFLFAGALSIQIRYRKQKHKPILSVDLMWADVEEDDMGAIIGLKKGRFKPVARAKWS